MKWCLQGIFDIFNTASVSAQSTIVYTLLYFAVIVIDKHWQVNLWGEVL